MQCFRVPPKIYFKRGSVDLALKELSEYKRAFIITDRFLFNTGVVNSVIKILEEIGISHQLFFEVKPDPTIDIVYQALNVLQPYEPDVIIAIGGGSVMDVAKIAKLLYEQPETNLSEFSKHYTDLIDNTSIAPTKCKKSAMVCIPTTSGSGAEVTPFAVIKNDKTNQKYTISDYNLIPDMAIIDANFTDNMPQGLTVASGLDALIHAIEAYTSIMSTNFTNSNALEAIKLIFKYLPLSYGVGKNAPTAREKMHYASTIAGIAFANSFISLCHHMAHKLGSVYNLPLGITNALLIIPVIRYKIANDTPELNYTKKYAQIAEELGFKKNSNIEKTEALIKELENLFGALNLPQTLKEYGIKQDSFENNLEFLSNNVYEELKEINKISPPDLKEIKQIYSYIYEKLEDK